MPDQIRDRKPRRLASLTAAAFLAAGVALSGPAQGEGRGFGGEFDIFVGGLHALELSITGEIGMTGYTVDAKAQTAGMLRSLYDAGLEAASTGRIGSRGLLPARFTAETRNSDKRQAVEMTWDGGRPAVTAEPAFEPKPWEIDPGEQRGLYDPLTAIASAFVPVARERLCDRTVEIFDGRRRYAVDLAKPEAPSAGGEIACEAMYRRIAGFKPKWMERAPKWPFRVFFAETSPGSWEVVRAEGRTSFGMAVLRRRG